jgi:hypothetical protein
MTKKPSLADINRRNAEFWEKQSASFDERVSKRPHDLDYVVKKTQERIEDGAIVRIPSLEAQIQELSVLRDADQSVRASSARKRKRDHRQIVIEAMRTMVRTSRLEDFLEAAANGSIEGIEIKAPGPRDGSKYSVTCDELDKDRKFSYSTISGWWTAAKKS